MSSPAVRDRGLMLVEMVVAVAVLGIVGAALAGVVVNAALQTRAVEERAVDIGRVEAVVGTIVRESTVTPTGCSSEELVELLPAGSAAAGLLEASDTVTALELVGAGGDVPGCLFEMTTANGLERAGLAEAVITP